MLQWLIIFMLNYPNTDQTLRFAGRVRLPVSLCKCKRRPLKHCPGFKGDPGGLGLQTWALMTEYRAGHPSWQPPPSSPSPGPQHRTFYLLELLMAGRRRT